MSKFVSYPITIGRCGDGYVAAIPDLNVEFFASSEQQCVERLQVEGDAAAQRLFEARWPLPKPSSLAGSRSMLIRQPGRDRAFSERRRRQDRSAASVCGFRRPAEGN